MPITGESSPYYLFHPLAAERIARDLPDVRLVVLLRDPVERAYSAYTHERARGFETETFARALELEPERLAGAGGRPARRTRTRSATTTSTTRTSPAGSYVEQLERVAAPRRP